MAINDIQLPDLGNTNLNTQAVELPPIADVTQAGAGLADYVKSTFPSVANQILNTGNGDQGGSVTPNNATLPNLTPQPTTNQNPQPTSSLQSTPSLPNFKLPSLANQILTPSDSQKAMINVETDIRGKEQTRQGELSYADNQIINSQIFGGIGDRRLRLQENSVNPDEVYTRLNNGQLIATVDNYIGGTNNQNRLAREQSRLSKLGYGLTRFVGKTLVNVAGGTIGVVDGIVSAIGEGRFSAVWDNDFGKYLDDLNTKMDYQLPIYKTADEEQMNFFQRLGTVSFWADEFLNGLSFLSGALLTEAAWSAVTFGASTTTAVARLGLRQGVRAGTSAGAAAGRSAVKQAEATLKGLNRSAQYARGADLANTLRFTLTSAGYESSVESRHSFKEAMDDFILSYQQNYGRTPSQEELSEFTNTALSASNAVFGLNMAIVGTSNFYQLGTYLGLKSPIRGNLGQRIGDTVFGRKTLRTIDDAGNIVYKTTRGNRLQRGLETGFNIVKNPFVEGVYEEGLQGVANNASKAWLDSRYSASATEQTLNLSQAFLEGLSESYGTREGQLEIGVGVLIGFFGGAGRTGADGRNTLFGIREAASLDNARQQAVTERNKANKGLRESLARNLTLISRMNQQSSALNAVAEALEDGDGVNAAINTDTANFTRMLMQDESGQFNEAVEDMNFILEQMSADAVRQLDPSLQNLSDEDIATYKTNIAETYEQDASDYLDSLEIARRINPNAVTTTDGIVENYTATLALNIYQGRKAYERLGRLSEAVDEVLGSSLVSDGRGTGLFRSWSLLNDRQREVGERLSKVEKELVRVQQQIEELATRDITVQNEVGEEESAQRVRENNRALDRRQRLNSQLLSLQQEQQDLQQAVSTARTVYDTAQEQFLGIEAENFTPEQLADIYDYVTNIQDIANTLRRNPDVNDAAIQDVEILLTEFARNARALQSFVNTAARMSDSRFLSSQEYSSIFKVKGITDQIIEGQATQTFEGMQFSPEVRQQIESLDLTADQKFTYATLLEMVNEGTQAENLEIATTFNENLREVEPISDEKYIELSRETLNVRDTDGYFLLRTTDFKPNLSDPVFAEIVRKSVEGEELSPREQDLYRQYKKQLYQRIYREQLRRGRRPTQPRAAGETRTQKLRRIITNAFNQSPTLVSEQTITDRPIKPTEEEIKLYKKLDRKARRGAYNRPNLTAKQQQEFDRLRELRDRIREYGNFVGVTIEGGINLADAFTLLDQLEQGQESVTTHTVGIEDTSVMLQGIPNINQENREDKNMYAQVWDKVTMSTEPNVELQAFETWPVGVVIQGLTFNGLLSHFENVTKLTRVSFDGVSTEIDPESEIRTERGERYVIELADGNKVNLFINTRNNPVFNLEEQFQIEANSDFLLSYLGDFGGAYKVVLSRNLTPIDSDYQTESGKQFDIEAVFDLQPGDTITAQVDLQNPYNQRLVEEYNNSPKGEVDYQRLRNNLVVELHDRNGKLVGIMKAAHADAAGTDSFAQLTQVRDQFALQITGQETVQVPTVVDTDTSFVDEINQVLPGINGRIDKILPINEAAQLARNTFSVPTSNLFNGILGVAQRMGITIQFSSVSESTVDPRPAFYNAESGNIVIQLPELLRAYNEYLSGEQQLNESQLTSLEDYLSYVITHETLHSVTVHAYTEVSENLENGEYTGTLLTQQQADALLRINDIYNYVKEQAGVDASLFDQNEYGLSSIYEFMAELSNTEFLVRLQAITLPENLQYDSTSLNIFDSLLQWLYQLITGNSGTAAENVIVALSDVLQADQKYAFTTPQVVTPSQMTTVRKGNGQNAMASGTVVSDMELTVEDTLPGRPNLNLEQGLQYNPLTPEAREKVLDVGYIVNGKLKLKRGEQDVNTYPYVSHIVNNKNGAYGNKYTPIVVFERGGKKYAYQARYDGIQVDITPDLEGIANSDIPATQKLLNMNQILIDNGISLNEYGFTPYDLNEETFNRKIELIQQSEIAQNISRLVSDDSVSFDELLNRIALDINLDNNPFHSPKFRVTNQTAQFNSSRRVPGLKMTTGIFNKLQSELNKPC